MILASITTYTGINSIRSSKFTKFRTQLEIMQAQVDYLHEKYKDELQESEDEGEVTNPEEGESQGKDKKEMIQIGLVVDFNDEKSKEAFTKANITEEIIEKSFIGAGVADSEREKYRYYDKNTLDELDIANIDIEFLVNLKDRKVIAIDGIFHNDKWYYTLEQIQNNPVVGGFERTENVTVENVSYEQTDNGYQIIIDGVKCSKYVGKYDVKYRESSENDYKTAGEGIKKDSYSFTVKKPGLYYIQVIDAAGQTTERPEIIVSVYGGATFSRDTSITMVKNITDEEVETGTVFVPDKATISGATGEVPNTVLGVKAENENYETLNDGVVMYFLNDGIVDWTNEDEVEIARKTYDQFVWVPVDNPVLDLSDNTTALASDNTIKEIIQNEVDDGRYPMAIKKDDGNYLGVLYQFWLSDNLVKISPFPNWTPVTKSEYSEPTVLKDLETSSNNNIAITETLLQENYNNMIEKVIANKGFLVGRYETSSMNSSSDDVKIGVIKGTTTGISNVNWYRMYEQQKNYKDKANITLTSSMIWGSQWDQIMIWMKNVKNEAKDSYYIINSLTMGNLLTDDSYSDKNNPAPTGFYAVKNIYDLAGNVFDWTLGAYGTFNRVVRGCNYGFTVINYMNASNRYVDEPGSSYTGHGSRIVMY